MVSMKLRQRILLIFIALLSALFVHSCVSSPVSSGPELVSPENNSVSVSFNNLTLRFKGVVGKTYDVIIKDSTTNAQVFTTTVKAENETVEVQIPKGTLSPDKKYKWYVRLTNNDSKSSAQWVFTTRKNTPPIVSGLLPDGTSNHPFGMLGLTWKAEDIDDDDLTFVVRIYEKDKEDKPYIETTVATNTYLARNLKQMTTYKWTVEAKDRWGGVALSTKAEFTTKPNEPPERIELLSPEDKAVNVKFNNLLLKWRGSDRDYEELKYTVYLYPEGAQQGKALLSLNPTTELSVTELSPNTNYILLIEAYDTYGEKLSKQFSFRTKVNTPPPAPNLLEPADKSRVNIAKVSSLKFKWDAVNDPDEDFVNYKFVIRSGTSERSMYPVNNPELEFSSLATFFKVGQRYEWYVVAIDRNGANATSPVFSFETYRNNPPTVPSDPLPGDDIEGKKPLPNRIEQFSWVCSDPDGDELKYDLYMGESPDNLKLKASDLKTSNYSTTELFEFGKRYYWKVVAKDGYNDPVESPVWTFKITDTKFPPTAPVLIAPSNGQNNLNFNNISLRWRASSDSDDNKADLEYYVYIGRADEMSLLQTVKNQTGDEISITVDGLKPVTTYYWRVEVKDPFGNYAYSDTWRFTTKSNTAPLWPSDPDPKDGQVVTVSSTQTTIPLRWNASDPDEDRITYEVYISQNPNFEGVMPLVTNNKYVNAPINNTGVYYWYVVAKDPHDGVTIGDVWSFEIRK